MMSTLSPKLSFQYFLNFKLSKINTRLYKNNLVFINVYDKSYFIYLFKDY